MPSDQLIRMAIRIQRQLSRPAHTSLPEWDKSMKDVLLWAAVVQNQFGLAKIATNHGWHAAAAEKQRHALADLRLLDSAIDQVRYQQLPTQALWNGPTLRTIVEEIKQLKHEFEDFEIDLKQGLIGVTTEPIELEGTPLGPFSIELHISRLADRLDTDCFKLIALEPNPASSNSDTVHPHVQNHHLCAGDATVPISNALKEGRIADAFILIRSVLMSYNSDSPYVSLENWHGTSCQDCGYTSDSDSAYFCDGCEHDVCEDCYSSCDICHEGCCRSCLEKDQVSDQYCCPACRRHCSECQRVVDEESFDDDAELCPECFEKQTLTHEQESQDELIQCSAEPNPTETAANAIPPTPVQAAA